MYAQVNWCSTAHYNAPRFGPLPPRCSRIAPNDQIKILLVRPVPQREKLNEGAQDARTTGCRSATWRGLPREPGRVVCPVSSSPARCPDPSHDAVSLPTHPALTMRGFDAAAGAWTEHGASGWPRWTAEPPRQRARAARLHDAGREVNEVDVCSEEQNAASVKLFVREVPTYFPLSIADDPPRAETARTRAERRGRGHHPRRPYAASIRRQGRPEWLA